MLKIRGFRNTFIKTLKTNQEDDYEKKGDKSSSAFISSTDG